MKSNQQIIKHIKLNHLATATVIILTSLLTVSIILGALSITNESIIIGIPGILFMLFAFITYKQYIKMLDEWMDITND